MDDSIESVRMQITLLIQKLLYSEEISSSEWQDLFWLVHHACVCKNGAQVVIQDVESCILNFTEQIQAVVLSCRDDDLTLLRLYLKEWQIYHKNTTSLMPPLRVIETYLKKMDEYENARRRYRGGVIKNFICRSWYENIFSKIKCRLYSGIMRLISPNRGSELGDSDLISGLRQSYINVAPESENKAFDDWLMRTYTHSIEVFYPRVTGKFLEENDAFQYFNFAFKKLEEEEQRAAEYLMPLYGNIKMVTECCVKVLFLQYKNRLLELCPSMIKHNDTENLKRMAHVMDFDPQHKCIKVMLAHLKEYIMSKGLEVVKATGYSVPDSFLQVGSFTVDEASNSFENSYTYVTSMVNFCCHVAQLVHSAFMNDRRFIQSRDEAFQTLLNDTSVFECVFRKRSYMVDPYIVNPTLFANLCDALLRKTPLSMNMTTDDCNEELGKLVTVLKFLDDKHIFMECYKTFLLRRIILNPVVDEREKEMIQCLKEIGMPRTDIRRLNKIIKDAEASYDLNKGFKDANRNEGNLAGSIDVKVVSSTAWERCCKPMPISLPPGLQEFSSQYQEFYSQQYCGRKLTWQHSLSHGIITFNHKNGKIDLDVTANQMAILFAWNDKPFDKISFGSLRLDTKIPDYYLRQSLWSLITMPSLKDRLLLCNPEVKSPKEFDDNTLFWINKDFSAMNSGRGQKEKKLNLRQPAVSDEEMAVEI